MGKVTATMRVKKLRTFICDAYEDAPAQTDPPWTGATANVEVRLKGFRKKLKSPVFTAATSAEAIKEVDDWLQGTGIPRGTRRVG